MSISFVEHAPKRTIAKANARERLISVSCYLPINIRVISTVNGFEIRCKERDLVASFNNPQCRGLVCFREMLDYDIHGYSVVWIGKDRQSTLKYKTFRLFPPPSPADIPTYSLPPITLLGAKICGAWARARAGGRLSFPAVLS